MPTPQDSPLVGLDQGGISSAAPSAKQSGVTSADATAVKNQGDGALSGPVRPRRGAPSQLAPWPRARYPDIEPTVVLNTNYTCDLRCRYCFAHPRPDDYARAPMTLEVAERAVEFLLTRLAADAPVALVRSGLVGEPVLAPEFLDSLGAYIRARAAHYGKRVEWHCGATMSFSTAPPSDRLRQLAWMAVSLDGPRDIHDRMRPFADGRGSYDGIIGALRAIAESEVSPFGPSFAASATLTSEAPDVTRVFLHLYELGFNTIAINPVRLPPGQVGAVDSHTVAAVKAEYSRFVSFLLAQQPDQLLSYLRHIIHPWDFFGRFLLRALFPGQLPYTCEAGKWYVAVDPDGSIYPCAAFAGARAYRMGSVFDGIDPEAHRFWAEEMFIENRDSCRACWARYMCGGGCYHQAFLTSGRADRPCPARCDLTKHLMEIALRMVGELKESHPDVLQALPDHRRSAPPSANAVACVRTTDAAVRDHNLANWHSSRPLRLCDPSLVRWKRWRGADDLSAEAHLGWDEACLYIRVEVQDDVFVAPSRRSRFATGDSLEVSLFAVPAPKFRYSFLASRLADGPDLVAYEVGLTDSAVPAGRRTAARVDVVRRGDCTDYRLAIPWSDLDGMNPKREVGISLRVNDDDGATRGWLQWPSDSAFGMVRFLARGA